MKVDGDIVSGAPQLLPESQISEQSADSATAGDHDHVGQMRVAEDDRSGWGFDEIGEVGIRKSPAQCRDGGRGQHHVANLTQAHQQDLQ